MAKAVVDPEELRRFASELDHLNRDLGARMKQLVARFNALSDTWRDQEHRKFADEFEQTVRVLSRFMATSEQQIPFLLRKAERVEDYLNQR